MVAALPVLDRMWGGRASLLDPGYARRTLPGWMQDHCVLVAEAGGDWRTTTPGRPAGFVVGLLVPHILNPGLLVLAECLWLADNARAGLALLDAFLEWGRAAGADWVTFSLMPTSPAGAGALKRRGFRVAETAYLAETGRWIREA
jgi:hypothetical protein